MLNAEAALARHPDRKALVLALVGLTDEAFDWFVAWAAGEMTAQYPDGLGGFKADSRDSIQGLRYAASNYIERGNAPRT